MTPFELARMRFRNGLCQDLARCCPQAPAKLVKITVELLVDCTILLESGACDTQQGVPVFLKHHARAVRGMLLCGPGRERSFAERLLAQHVRESDGLLAVTPAWSRV